jgi:hypothetical protein
MFGRRAVIQSQLEYLQLWVAHYLGRGLWHFRPF